MHLSHRPGTCSKTHWRCETETPLYLHSEQIQPAEYSLDYILSHIQNITAKMIKQSWIVVRHKERTIGRRGYETEMCSESKTILS